MRAVTVLVVFCPCAFVLATPTAVAAAIGNLTRYGVLVRTGDALQRLAEIDSVAFDKTGTLTTGKPQVTAVRPLAESFDEASMLHLAASAESGSEHPLGKAIVKYFQSQVASAEGTGGNQGHAHVVGYIREKCILLFRALFDSLGTDPFLLRLRLRCKYRNPFFLAASKHN